MKFAKLTLSLIVGISFFVLFSKFAKASDGTVELVSTTQDNYRCFVASIFVGNYKVLVSCKDLVYPKGDQVMSYVLWGTSTSDNKPIKFGTLDFGRKFFQTKSAFSNLYVTLESNSKIKSPSGAIVMRGSVQPISFLEEPTTVSPAPEGAEETKPEETTTAEEQPSTREKLLTALRRAGIAALFALVALIGLIFVITRSRR